MTDTSLFPDSPFTLGEVELAAQNYSNQERLADGLRNAAQMAGLTAEHLAKELELTQEEAESWLDGEADLRLSDLRHFANALDACIAYSVKPLRNSYRQNWMAIQSTLTEGPPWSEVPSWADVTTRPSLAKW